MRALAGDGHPRDGGSYLMMIRSSWSSPSGSSSRGIGPPQSIVAPCATASSAVGTGAVTLTGPARAAPATGRGCGIDVHGDEESRVGLARRVEHAPLKERFELDA